ncbi:hypothetical protein VNO77_44193 [Canavalia gladiata]|uniref:Uncharacterized protein n=1 Tax=Canavalia gladiata TaxID=3824 RepID=A0AAN9JW89_CANGL
MGIFFFWRGILLLRERKSSSWGEKLKTSLEACRGRSSIKERKERKQMLQWRVENATFFYQVSRFFRRKISPRGLVPAIEGNTKLLRTNVSFTLVLSEKPIIDRSNRPVFMHMGRQAKSCGAVFSSSPLRALCTASACIPLASFCYTFKFIAEFYGKPQEAREQERCWVVNLERTVLKLQWRESHVDATVGLLNIYFEGPVRRVMSRLYYPRIGSYYGEQILGTTPGLNPSYVYVTWGDLWISLDSPLTSFRLNYQTNQYQLWGLSHGLTLRSNINKLNNQVRSPEYDPFGAVHYMNLSNTTVYPTEITNISISWPTTFPYAQGTDLQLFLPTRTTYGLLLQNWSFHSDIYLNLSSASGS